MRKPRQQTFREKDPPPAMEGEATRRSQTIRMYSNYAVTETADEVFGAGVGILLLKMVLVLEPEESEGKEEEVPIQTIAVPLKEFLKDAGITLEDVMRDFQH